MSYRYETSLEDLSGAIHFIGIGGAGMSGIAEVLLSLNCRVQGSDLAESPAVYRLRELGAKIFPEHSGSNVGNASVVVVSSAIDEDNPEIQAAQKARIPVIKRAEMLAELMRFRFGIAVAGTHGKTTTTSLAATALSAGGLNPTYVVGGKVEGFDGHALHGESKYLVVEADESDASFLHLNPVLAVVTNVDADHLGTYRDDFDALAEGFKQFLENLPFYGTAVVCNEDTVLQSLRERVARRFLTYGFSEDCDIYAREIEFDEAGSRFKIRSRWNEQELAARLKLPGRHNVLNALAALGVAHILGIDESKALTALANFKGIARRFQNYGDVQTANGKVTIIDDYAHHPTEISATYEAACEAWPQRRKVVVFQPHRYTRLKALFDEFVNVLGVVDQLVLMDVYPAGESALPGADGESLLRALTEQGKCPPIYAAQPEDVPPVLDEILCDEDIVILMGAGSVGSLAEAAVQRYGGACAA